MMQPAPAPGGGDDAALLERARAGDLEAFNALVEAHQRAVYNLCLRLLGNSTAAEDSTQDTFLSSWRAIGTFRGTSFRPWVMRIAANACTDEVRRRVRRPALSLDIAPPGSDEPIDLPDAAPGPETEALRGEQQAVIQAALLRLPQDQRLAVVLCDVQGYSYDEIAETTGVSIGTVKSRIARAREKLRGLLAEGTEQAGGRIRQKK